MGNKEALQFSVRHFFPSDDAPFFGDPQKVGTADFHYITKQQFDIINRALVRAMKDKTQ